MASEPVLPDPSAPNTAARSQPSRPDPLLGQVLASEFRILRVLGEGGMGTVYQAEQLSLKRRVAIKLLPAAAGAAPEVIGRFQREAQVAARLVHANVVQVYLFGQDGDRHFLVMEFVDGETLGRRLLRAGRLPPAEVLRIGAEVARGLAAAHQRGLVHRDVKPDNVFLGRDGAVKLGDFGLAREVLSDAGLTAPGTVLGTPHYMAPEQCLAKPVDARTDLYALGAMLHHALTGRTPFEAPTLQELLVHQISQPAPRASAHVTGVPQGLDDLLGRLLEKDPARRIQSADDVVAALEAIAAGRAPSLQSPPLPVPSRPPPERTSEAVAARPPGAGGALPSSAAPEAPGPPAVRIERMRYLLVAAGGALLGLFAYAGLMEHLTEPAASGPALPAVPPGPVVNPILRGSLGPACVTGTPAVPAPIRNAEDEAKGGGPAAVDGGGRPPVSDGVGAERAQGAPATVAADGGERPSGESPRPPDGMPAGRAGAGGEAAEGVTAAGGGTQALQAAEERRQEEARMAEERRRTEARDAARWRAVAQETWDHLRAGSGPEAAERAAAGERELSGSAWAEPAAALVRVVERVRRADAAAWDGVRRAVNEPVCLRRADGALLRGRLLGADSRDGLVIALAGDERAQVTISLGHLAAGERARLAAENLGADADADAAAAAGLLGLAGGDAARLCAFLRRPAAEQADAGEDLRRAAEGWAAPWAGLPQHADPGAADASGGEGAPVLPTPRGPAAEPKPRTFPRVEQLPGGVTLDLIELPGGRFTMGSPETEPGREPNEGPMTPVTVGPFAIGRTEVTQAQFAAILSDNHSLPADPLRPVNNVNLGEALDFCHRLSKHAHWAYRLPTEAEWEYACRAGSRTAFPFDESAAALAEFAWYQGNSDRHPFAYEAGTRKPNAWGICDLLGNVAEWCGTQARAYPYSSYDGRETQWREGQEAAYVVRGGSIQDIQAACRPASRHHADPEWKSPTLGFRVVCAPRPR